MQKSKKNKKNSTARFIRPPELPIFARPCTCLKDVL